MTSRLRGRTALVTGACGGLGREFVGQLLARGAALVASDRDEAALSALAGDCARAGAHRPLRATVAADLSTREGCEHLANCCEALGGPPDLVVHNAGVLVYGRFHETPLEQVYALHHVNVAAPLHLTARLLGPMLERGSGHLLFVCSVSGFVPTAFETAYSASKFALRGLGMALHRELRGTGMGVTIVYPFWVDTPMLASPSFGSVVAARAPAYLIQSPRTVVRAALDGAERGRLHVYPGVWPRLTWWLCKLVPLTASQPHRHVVPAPAAPR